MNGLPEIMSFWSWVWYVIVPVALLFVALCIFAWPGDPPAQPTNEEDLAKLSEEQKRA